jgi:hypothetical protein
MECGLGIPAIDSLADTGSIVTATWSHPFRHALPRGFSVVDWFRAHIGNRSSGTIDALASIDGARPHCRTLPVSNAVEQARIR